MLGAILGGAASLVSGLFGRSDAKDQARKERKAIASANAKAEALAAQMNREARARADAAALVPVATERENITRSVSQGGVDMAGFMKAAEDNGFNPLTFLRSGALALFARNSSTTSTEDWTCTTGERAMDAAMQGQYIPQLAPVVSQTQVPSMGSVIGNALNTGVGQYLNDLDIERNNQLQANLLNRQIAGANQSGSLQGSRSGYVPAAFISGTKVAKPGGGELRASPAPRHQGYILTWPKAAVEPDTELDEGASSLDQVLAGMRDWWRNSSFKVGTIPGTPADNVRRQILTGRPGTSVRFQRPQYQPGQGRLGPGERY